MLKRVVAYVAAAVAGIFAAVMISGVFMITEAMGSGMEPAVNAGSHIIINKAAYLSEDSQPKTGDVIAFKSSLYGEEGEGSILIRRVAGVAGDTVEIKDDIFYLNGMPYTDYMNEAVHMEDMSRIKLEKGEIFVLSDDRKSSMDSRNEAIGVINVKDCIGKICFK